MAQPPDLHAAADSDSGSGTHLPASALKVPAFQRYFLVSCFSTFGLWILRFLIGWSAWSLTESALWVGMVSAAMLIPTFVLSPLFGVLADRINLRHGLSVTTLGQGLVGIAGAVLTYNGWLNSLWLLVLAAFLGMVAAAHHPMRLAMMPRLIAKALLPSGIGWSAMIFNSSRIVGPAIAAWLLTVGSLSVVFLVSGLLFITGVVLLQRVPSAPPEAEAGAASVLSDLVSGFRFALGSVPIRIILALTMVNGLMGRTVIELLPAISGRLLNGDAQILALLTALAGVGAIVGGLIMTRQKGQTHRLVRVVLLSLLASALLLVTMVWLQTLTAVATVILLLSLSMTVTGTGCQALTQLSVSDQYRGRVLSFWTVIAIGVPAIGAFLVGAAADTLGFGPVLTGVGILGAGLVILLAPGRHSVSA